MNEQTLVERVAEILKTKQVKVGECTVILAAPRSYSIGYEVGTAFLTNKERAWAAALGICWQAGASLGLPGKYSDTFNVLEYGGRVIDVLLDRGVPYNEILIAGIAATTVLEEKLIQLTTAQIEAAEKNS